MANFTFDYSGTPWTTPAEPGPPGGTGPAQKDKGQSGKSSYNSGNCKWSCSVQPQSGPKGNSGLTPDTPTQAAKGKPGVGGVHRLGLLKGPITILIGGADGQIGAKGGTGGPGGPGGAPGAGATGCNNSVSTGPQGKGGKGGDGGQGGDGGESPLIKIYYSYTGADPEPIKVTANGVSGGDGGTRGDPGKGVEDLGYGTKGPRGNPGQTPNAQLNREN